jgi:hypothetical protein
MIPRKGETMKKAAGRAGLLTLICAVFILSLAFVKGHAFDASSPLMLMFGADTSQNRMMRFLDFQYITPAMKLGEGESWGWTNTDKLTGWTFKNDQFCSYPMDGLLEHCIRCNSGSFAVRGPAGRWRVHLWIGDTFENFRNTRASFRVDAEGRTVVDEKVTFANISSERWWLRGQSEVYRRTADRWARQVKPILDEYDFEADVADGVLNLDMKNVNLCAMVVLPAGAKAVMGDILASIERSRRAQFEMRYPWSPQPDEPMPPIRPRDEKRGFVAFQKSIDDDLYPWSRPAEAEIKDSFSAVAARGEQEPVRFGVLPLRDLSAFTVSVGDFSGPGGAKINIASGADLWMERYMEHGAARGAKRGGNMDPLSDVLFEVRPLDYEPGLPRLWTLDIRVPRDAPPGLYRAPLTFFSEGRIVDTAEIVLRVLSWELLSAPVPYSFQPPAYRNWSDLAAEGSDNAAVRRFIESRVRFIAKYGFNTSYFYPSVWGSWGSIVGEPGQRHLTQTPAQAEAMNWWYQTAMKIGNAGSWIQFQVAPFLTTGFGLQKFDFKKKIMEEKSAADRRDLVQIVRDFEALVRKNGYPKHYYYTTGEPDNFGLAGVEEGNELAKICREAGAQTLCTLNGPIGARLCPPFHNIVLANHATPITDEFIARVETLGDKFGAHNTGDTRLAAGYQFWRMHGVTKFQEMILYTSFMAPYAYLPWNYRVSAVYPREDGGWRPTVRWLRYRDGRDDFLYMWNLERLLEKTRAAGRGDTAPARKAADFLKTMHDRISADPRDYFPEQLKANESDSGRLIQWTGPRFESCRARIAELIADLGK